VQVSGKDTILSRKRWSSSTEDLGIFD